MKEVQFELSFQAGLREQFPQFQHLLQACVTGCGRAHKLVAADLDMTSSELSRKLADNPNDPVHFPVQKLPELIRATGDMRPIFWLIEEFLDDGEAKRKRQLAELSALIPTLQRLLHSAGVERGAA